MPEGGEIDIVYDFDPPTSGVDGVYTDWCEVITGLELDDPLYNERLSCVNNGDTKTLVISGYKTQTSGQT